MIVFGCGEGCLFCLASLHIELGDKFGKHLHTGTSDEREKWKGGEGKWTSRGGSSLGHHDQKCQGRVIVCKTRDHEVENRGKKEGDKSTKGERNGGLLEEM